MTAHKSPFLLIALLLASLCGISDARAQTVTGSWTIQSSDIAGQVQLTFVHDHSNNSMDWKTEDLKGLDLASSGRHDVHFTIERDAGRIAAEGSATGDTAAGGFLFTPAAGYAAEMRKLGLGEFRSEQQIAFVLHDVSLAFARDMIGLRINGLTANNLLAMRIHGADPAYVREVRAAGARAGDADQVIALRIHRVSPAFVAAFHRAGIEPDDAKLIALAIQGATPEWIAGMDQLGYGHNAVGADQLIAFRIHGVTPDYIEALAKLGYRHPDPDQLIAMRIHSVTPEYIASVKAKGVKDLTLNQLVAMRIHGID